MDTSVKLVGPVSVEGASASVVGCAVADEDAKEIPPVLDLEAILRNIITALDNDKTPKRRALKRSIFHFVYRLGWQKVTGFSVYLHVVWEVIPTFTTE